MMKWLNPNSFAGSANGRWWFFGVFLGLCLIFAYQKILFFPPHSIHAWRQSDCLSLAQHFMDENNPLRPAIHNHISDGGRSGKSAGEFTGLYYLVGKIWTITGKHQSIYRFMNLLFMFLGCWALFCGIQEHWKNTFWSLFVSMFLFTSPIIVYYTPNYLTDITALAFTLWAWGAFLKYLKNRANRALLISFSLFGLAALFKVTAGISFLALLGVFGLELIGVLRNNLLFPQKLKTLIYAVGVLIPVFLWYIYAEHYNNQHGGKYTFNNLWPLWEITHDHYLRALKFFSEITFSQFFFAPVFWMLTALTISALYLGLKHNIRIFIFLVFSVIGSILYVIFWFGALENHDYYFINLFFLPLVVLGINIHFFIISGKNSGRLRTIIVSLAALIFSIGIVYSASNIRLRYSERLAVGYGMAITLYGKKQVEFWYYMASSYRNRGLFTIEAYNRSIGIKPTDLVICYPDPSFNISLYLLNQEGWTSFNNGNHDSIPFKQQVDLGAKYLIINRIELPETPQLIPFMTDSIGYHEGYTIYKL